MWQWQGAERNWKALGIAGIAQASRRLSESDFRIHIADDAQPRLQRGRGIGAPDQHCFSEEIVSRLTGRLRMNADQLPRPSRIQETACNSSQAFADGPRQPIPCLVEFLADHRGTSEEAC